MDPVPDTGVSTKARRRRAMPDRQQKMVETLRSDPQTSEEEHFKLILVQTEMERVKFVIRSYVRTRLHKVSRRHRADITLSPT